MAVKRRTWAIVLVGWLGILLAVPAIYEMRTSRLQAHLLSRLAKELKYGVGLGPSQSIRFPQTGPYDQRLGYVDLPSFVERLTAKGYRVEEQARASPHLLELTDRGIFPIYREKVQAGLRILDREGQPLFAATFPERVYPSFEDIPERVVQALLFIENRELLDARFPCRNPAVEWDRLANAGLHLLLHAAVPEHNVPGGSTLATQIEKFRHSPDGLTASVQEKFRQMASASLRAYLGGEQTLETRQRIVVAYLSSIPLAAAPGYGEVIGLGDGLWVWYGADFAQVNSQLISRPPADLPSWALSYKQVLSLFVAQRRPSSYLVKSPEALAAHTDSYLRLLAAEGLVSPAERDAAIQAKLKLTIS